MIKPNYFLDHGTKIPVSQVTEVEEIFKVLRQDLPVVIEDRFSFTGISITVHFTQDHRYVGIVQPGYEEPIKERVFKSKAALAKWLRPWVKKGTLSDIKPKVKAVTNTDLKMWAMIQEINWPSHYDDENVFESLPKWVQTRWSKSEIKALEDFAYQRWSELESVVRWFEKRRDKFVGGGSDDDRDYHLWDTVGRGQKHYEACIKDPGKIEMTPHQEGFDSCFWNDNEVEPVKIWSKK